MVGVTVLAKDRVSTDRKRRFFALADQNHNRYPAHSRLLTTTQSGAKHHTNHLVQVQIADDHIRIRPSVVREVTRRPWIDAEQRTDCLGTANIPKKFV